MIARTWIGETQAAEADQYLAYLHETGLSDLRATPGNVGVVLKRSISGDVATFELTSYWKSEDDIRRFAGEDIRVARYYPQDERFLFAKTPFVAHADVVFADLPNGLAGA